MKILTKAQKDTAVISDLLQTFTIKASWVDEGTRTALETEITNWYADLEPHQQAETVFIESALKYIRNVATEEE